MCPALAVAIVLEVAANCAEDKNARKDNEIILNQGKLTAKRCRLYVSAKR